MRIGNTNHKGNVAEMAIATAATKLGVDVSKPLVEHARYDLIFDLRPELLRVQCKWAPLKNGVVQVRLSSTYYTSRGEQVSSTYDRSEIDALAVYFEALDCCYLLPAALIERRRAIYLRTARPLNAQRAALNWAADYDLSGAIAQLGERSAGSRKVVGSSPTSSTPRQTTVGAHEFRNHFGWYMERAEAGDRITVTKRGRPIVQLTAIAERQALPTDAPVSSTP